MYTLWKGIYYNNTTLIIHVRITHDNMRLSILYIGNLTPGIFEKYKMILTELSLYAYIKREQKIKL